MPFCDLTRSWDTNRNWISPRNVREISSSVYCTTRQGQLYIYNTATAYICIDSGTGTRALWRPNCPFEAKQGTIEFQLLWDDQLSKNWWKEVLWQLSPAECCAKVSKWCKSESGLGLDGNGAHCPALHSIALNCTQLYSIALNCTQLYLIAR